MVEIVLWQYRWTNPANEPNHLPEMLAWKAVEHPHWQPLESKLQELRDYRYNGKPCYEVCALCVIPDGVPEARRPVIFCAGAHQEPCPECVKDGRCAIAAGVKEDLK